MTKGVVILGVISFVIGATVFSLMIYTLVLEEQLQTTKDKIPIIGQNVSYHHAFRLDLKKTTIDIIVSFVFLISFLKMIFSILLLIGIKKNKPSLVVAYFSFGSLLCLLLLVSAVLELIHYFWYTAIITVLFTFIMMERLSAVYSVYEDMVKDGDFNLLLDGEVLNDQEPIDTIICN